MGWFLYDNGLRHERVKNDLTLSFLMLKSGQTFGKATMKNYSLTGAFNTHTKSSEKLSFFTH